MDSPTTCDDVSQESAELTAIQALAQLASPEALAKGMRSHIIVRSDVIFQVPNRPTRVWGQPYGFDVESDEQPYERWQPVTEQWAKLSLHWIDKPSVVYLSNPPSQFSVQPTDEQRKEAEDRVVEVAQSAGLNPFTEIEPGRDCHFKPTSEMFVRCRCGSVKLLVAALPS